MLIWDAFFFGELVNCEVTTRSCKMTPRLSNQRHEPARSVKCQTLTPDKNRVVMLATNVFTYLGIMTFCHLNYAYGMPRSCCSVENTEVKIMHFLSTVQTCYFIARITIIPFDRMS